jgi:uncharacterized lipoprotein YddW (UPF0748 family)
MPVRKEDRKYWVWRGRNTQATTAELKAEYSKLKSHGIYGVFLADGVDEKAFDVIKEVGLELHSWMWTTNRRDQWIRDNHPDWFMVSRTGKSCFDNPPYVDYYRWVSPVIPGVQNYLNDRVAELAAHPALSGVHLDYVRYPDIVLPTALWAKYGLDQTHELPEYDFCYSEHTRNAFKEHCGRDPLEIEDPAHDQEWLHFRYNSVTKLVKNLVAAAHEHGKVMTAAVFPTPRMARKICRQDWDKWPLDAVCPMTYHGFYDETVDWIGTCALENIQAVDFPVYSGLHMPDFRSPAEFQKGIKSAIENGASGVSLFDKVGEGYWDAFEEAIA